ncbi:MAG: hypothetical protein ACTSR2_03675 [Candidatus Hodarchaeales archaeon]
MEIQQLEDILERLKQTNLISESAYIRSINDLENLSPNPIYPINPILLMFNLIKAFQSYIWMRERVERIENEIKQAVVNWERGKLSKEDTKRILTNLVSQKNRFEKVKGHQLKRVKSLYSTIEDIDGTEYFDLDDYLLFLLDNSEMSAIIDFIVEFKDVWAICRNKIRESGAFVKKEIVQEVETDILASLTPSLDSYNRVSFDLEEILPSFEDYQSNEELFNIERGVKEIQDKHSAEDKKKQGDISDPWDYVGKIAFKEDKHPLALIRPPIVVKGIIYLPLVKEKPIEVSRIKKKYKKQFKQAGLPVEKVTLHEIRKHIAKKLGIPEEMGLQPTWFNKWLSLNSVVSIPEKPVLSKVWFVKFEEIKTQAPQKVVIKEEQLETIRIPAWIPAPGSKIVHKEVIGKEIYGMAGSNFGRIVNLIESCPFGQALLTRREFPPSKILEVFLNGLGKQNISELRFFIAKTLGVGEGEAFTPENMWEINNKERILISPHYLISSYYTVLPAKAFEFNSRVQAKSGVYFHSIPETFRYLFGKEIFLEDNKKIGTIYGFDVSDLGFDILWTKKSAEEIIKEVGRKSSPQYIQRFKHRVSMALGVPSTASLWPSNLARYFLNFIWMEENLSLKDAMHLIEKRFLLQRTSFSDITKLSEAGMVCKR